MSELIYDQWQGLVFGDDGSTNLNTTAYGLQESPGLNDLRFSGAGLDAPGTGLAHAPLYADARSWVTVIDLNASTAAYWEAKRDALLAATSITTNTATEAPYTITHRDTVRTVFARVISRDVPRDRNAMVSRFATASISFSSIDPVMYGPLETETFTGASDSEAIDSDGWVESWRWKWVVPGPVTNPMLSSNLHSSMVIRYVGSISSGYNLVVEQFPQGHSPGYYAKVVADADVDDYATIGVGTNAYGNLDRGPSGSGVPPRWFPVAGGEQTISYSATSGTAGSTWAWRPGFD